MIDLFQVPKITMTKPTFIHRIKDEPMDAEERMQWTWIEDRLGPPNIDPKRIAEKALKEIERKKKYPKR